MRLARDRRGIALPFALLVLLAISALGASGFFRAFLEGRSAQNQAAAVRAFYIAESGLNQALATSGADTAAISTRSYEIEGGAAHVRSRRLLRLDAAREVRLLLADGVLDPGREAPARRSVGQLVLAPLPFRPVAALVSADTAFLGTAALISGFDRTAGGCSDADAVAGLAVPPGAFTGDVTALSGRPPLLTVPAGRATLSSSGVDWPNAGREEFVEPEHLITDEWLPPPADDPPTWPATFVRPSAPPIGEALTGRGALVVTGNLTVTGELHWIGLVLVAGSLDVPGRMNVDGAVIVGLDDDPQARPGRTNLSGAVEIRYDGCAVAGAAARLARGPIRRPGGWFEAF